MLFSFAGNGVSQLLEGALANRVGPCQAGIEAYCNSCFGSL
jgi:hypothetical protein